MPKLILGADALAWKGEFISVLKRPFTNIVSGKSGNWEIVERKIAGRIVGVIAVTPEREAILIKIFRVPLKRYVIECAAGLPDHPDETEEALARRELLEETGYACGKLDEVVAGPINSGLVADEIVYFLGTDARKVAGTDHEDAEDIEVLKVPVDDLERFLRNPPDGAVVDLKIWALLPFLAKC